MTTITLPTFVEEWAKAEVAAGRAESVEAAVLDALAEATYPDPDPGKTTKELIAEALASVDAGRTRPWGVVRADLHARISRLEHEE